MATSRAILLSSCVKFLSLPCPIFFFLLLKFSASSLVLNSINPITSSFPFSSSFSLLLCHLLRSSKLPPMLPFLSLELLQLLQPCSLTRRQLWRRAGLQAAIRSSYLADHAAASFFLDGQSPFLFTGDEPKLPSPSSKGSRSFKLHFR